MEGCIGRTAEQSRATLPRSQLCFLVLLVASATLLFVFYSNNFTDLWTSDLHQAFLLSRHVEDYPVLIRPRSCRSRSPASLLLALKSHSTNVERRKAIRNTWGRGQLWGGKAVRRVFLLGLSVDEGGSRGGTDDLLREENVRHGDILQWSFKESFFNVTLKELLFWRWFQQECAGSVPYILKGDDDVFVNVGQVLGFAQHLLSPAEPLYIGHVFTDTYPVRWWWSKYYIPESLFSGPYPPYVGGGGYLISQKTIPLLLRASSEVPLFPIDDAYVGMCAQVANITVRHHQGFMPFEFDPRKQLCSYRDVMVLHRLQPAEQYLLWNFYKEHGHTCEATAISNFTL